MEEYPDKAITRLRREGRLDEALELGRVSLKQSPDNSYLKQAIFWVCYEFLKKIQEAIKRRGKESGNFKPTTFELDEIDKYLNIIKILNLSSGGNICVYRSLFLVFQKNLGAIPELVLLLLEHEPAFEIGKDDVPYASENGESSSLMLKFAREIAAAWLESEVVRAIGVDDIIGLINKTKQVVKNEKSIIWLDYDTAKILIRVGRFDLARDVVISVLKMKSTESWAWAALAATYQENAPDIAIKLFCEGICHAHDPKFSLKSFKSLIPLLVAKGMAQEASMCIKTAVAIYKQEGWRIKSDLEDLMNTDWYDDSVDSGSLIAFAKTQAEGAKVYLYGETISKIGVVKSVHASGKGINVFLNKESTKSVRNKMFGKKKPPSPGEFVEVIISKDGDVVSAKLTPAVDLDDVGFGVGTLSLNAKGFGFVDGAFVPHGLISPDLAGKTVQYTKILDFDKKKECFSWKVIALKLEYLSDSKQN